MAVEFFSNTGVAAKAFRADFNFRRYGDPLLHFDAIITFLAHVLRAIYNFLEFVTRLVTAPIRFWFSPVSYPFSILDHAVALGISLVSVAVHPFVVVLRTLHTIIAGYDYDECELGLEEEKDAMRIFEVNCCGASSSD